MILIEKEFTFIKLKLLLLKKNAVKFVLLFGITDDCKMVLSLLWQLYSLKLFTRVPVHFLKRNSFCQKRTSTTCKKSNSKKGYSSKVSSLGLPEFHVEHQIAMHFSSISNDICKAPEFHVEHQIAMHFSSISNDICKAYTTPLQLQASN